MTETTVLAQEQEESLIGALLKQPDKIELVNAIIDPESFHNHALGWAFGSMIDLHARGLKIDTVTLGDELERTSRMQDFVIGSKAGRMALNHLREQFRYDNPESYAAKILDYAAKRTLLEAAGKMAYYANNGRNSSDIRDDMIKTLTDIKVPNAKLNKHTQTFKEALSQAWDEANNGTTNFTPTGFIDLDHKLDGGLYAPDFMILAGRPGRGKTSLLLSIAKHAAELKKRTILFSLEMSNMQVVMRTISMQTGIPFGAMRRGRMDPEQWTKYNQAVEEFEILPLHLNDMPAIKINEMRQVLRRIEAVDGKIDLVIVDYLQLQSGEGDFGTREQEVGSISRGLKSIAKEFDIPVLAAAQLNRAIESRAERKPVLSDLRESGSLEQDTDIVAFIHQPDETNVNKIELIIAKHRNGPPGAVPLTFRPELTKFENAARY